MAGDKDKVKEDEFDFVDTNAKAEVDEFDFVDTEVKKKEPTATVSAAPVSQPTKPLQESGVKVEPPSDLPETYQSDRKNTKDLVAGKQYNLKRGGLSVTGTWDANTQTFIKSPLLDLTPKQKESTGIVEKIAAIESNLPTEPKFETEEEVLSRNYDTSNRAKEDAAKKATAIGAVNKIPALMAIDELQKKIQENPNEKSLQIQIDELRKKGIDDKDFVGIRFEKGSEGQVYQNFTPNKPTQSYGGEVMKMSNEAWLPEDYKKAKTIGELYDSVKDDIDYVNQVKQETEQFDNLLNEKLISNLPDEDKQFLESLKGTEMYDEEVMKTLVRSKETSNVFSAAIAGLKSKLDGIYSVGNNIGLTEDEMDKKMRREIAYDELFRVKPKGFAAELSSSVGGMIPDLAAGAIASPLMIASMLSTMPQDKIKEYYNDSYANGRVPNIKDAMEYAGISTLTQGGLMVGVGALGGKAINFGGKTTLARTGELITELAKRGSKDALIFGGGGTALQNQINDVYDMTKNDDYLNSMTHMAAIGILFGMKENAGKVFKSKLSKKTNNEIDYLASYLPLEYNMEQVKSLVEKGNMTPSEGDAVLEKMATYRNIRNQIPTEVSFEQVEKISSLWDRKKEIESMMKVASPEFQSVLKGQIRDLDQKILIEAAVPLTGEEKAELSALIKKEATDGTVDNQRLKYLQDRKDAAKEENEKQKTFTRKKQQGEVGETETFDGNGKKVEPSEPKETELSETEEVKTDVKVEEPIPPSGENGRVGAGSVGVEGDEKLTGEQVKNKLQEIEKQPVKINITQDANGKMEQTSQEVIDNIKSELDKTGLPYSDVISNEKGSTYFVVTKDGQQHEILKVLQSGGKLVPTNLTKAKWINHLLKTEKDAVVKSVEQSLKETPQAETNDNVESSPALRGVEKSATQEEIEATAKALEEAVRDSPINFIEEEDGRVRMTGGGIEVRVEAKKADKIQDVKTPSSLYFLPKKLTLSHLSRNQKDKNNIIKNGFDLRQVSIDSPIKGAYFSSEDWSSMDRFGRAKENSIYVDIDNDGLLYFDSTKSFRDYLKENDLPYRGETLSDGQIQKLKDKGIKGILLREDFASQSRNELIVIDDSIIKNISESPKDITKLPSSFSDMKSIAEAYHKAKEDGSNRELVKSVEQSLKETTKEEVTENKNDAHNGLVDNLRGFNNSTKKDRVSQQGRIQKQKLIDMAEKLGYRAVEGKDGKLVIIDGKQKIGYRGDAIKKQSLEDKAAKEDYRKARKRALNAEPTSLRQAIMQWFVGGGKMHDKAFETYSGAGKGDKQSARWGLSSDSRKSINEDLTSVPEIFAQWSAETKGSGAKEVASEVASVLGEFSSREDMERALVEAHEDFEFKAEHDGMSKEQYAREIARAQEENDIAKAAGENQEDVQGEFDKVDEIEIDEKDISDAKNFLDSFRDKDGNVNWDEALSAANAPFSEHFDKLPRSLLPKIDKIIADGKADTGTGNKNVDEGDVGKQEEGNPRTREENQSELNAKQRELAAAESEYERLNKGLNKDLANKQLGIALEDADKKGKQINLIDDNADLSNRINDAKKKVDALRNEVNRLEKLVDEDLDGQQKMDLVANADSKKLTPDEEISEGLSDLLDSIGGKINLTGDERKSALSALTKIGRGLVRKGTATVSNVVQKIWEIVKDKINEIDFAELSADLKEQIKQEITFDNWKNYAKKQFEVEDGALDFQEFKRRFNKKFNVSADDAELVEVFSEAQSEYNSERKPSPTNRKDVDRSIKGEKVMVEVDEMKALKDQIKLEAKAARDGFKAAKAEQVSFAKRIKDFLNNNPLAKSLSPSQVKALVNRAASVKTEAQLDKFMDYAQKVVDNANYSVEMDDIRNMQAKARKRNHVSYGGIVKEFTSINPELIPSSLIVEYKSALDDLIAQTPSYKKMGNIFYEIAQANVKEDRFSNVKTFQDAQELYNKIGISKIKSVEDYRSLFKDINAFKRKVEQLFENEDITEQERDDLINQIGQDQVAVEAKYESEITSLKTDLINEIRDADKFVNTEQLSAEEKKLIERFSNLDNNDLRNLSPEELYNLSDMLGNLRDEGRLDVFRFSPLVNRAEAAYESNKLTEQVSKAKPFKDVFDNIQDVVKKLGLQYASFWENELGLGAVNYGAYQKYVVAPMERAISSYRKDVNDGYKFFNEAKKKYGIKTDEQMNRIGAIATYLREYGMGLDPKHKGKKDSNGNVLGTRDWIEFMLNDEKTSSILGSDAVNEMKAIWNKLPQINGKVSPEDVFNSFTANDGRFLTNSEMAFLKDVMDWRDKNMTGKQKYANELRGKPFEDILFHIKRIRKGETKSQASTPIEVSEKGNVRISAGSGKQVTNNELGAVETNFERIFSETLEENARDYHVTQMLQKQNDVLNKSRQELPENRKAYVDVMKRNLAESVNNEFAKSKSTQLTKVVKNLMQARAAQVLIAPIRTVGELVAAIGSYPFRAKEVKAYSEVFKNRDTVKKLMDYTESPYRNKVDLSRQFDVDKGDIKGEPFLQKASELFAALPERLGVEPVWMATFDTAFKKDAGVDFDRQEYLSNPLYSKKYNKAIMAASAVADATYGQIAGATTQSGQRRQIKILPKMAARAFGVDEGVDAKTTGGRIAAFMTGYPYREVEQILKSGSAFIEATKGAEYTKGDAAKSLMPIAGVFTSAMVYNYWQAINYQMQQIIFGDDEDEIRAKEELSKMATMRSASLEVLASMASTLSARYSGLSRQGLVWLGSLYYNMTDDSESKQATKDFVRNVTFKAPFELQKTKSGDINKFMLKEKITTSVADGLVFVSSTADNAYKAVESVGGAKYLYDKVEKGELLSQPEKDALVLMYVAVNMGNAVVQFGGYGIPSTTLNKVAKGIIKEKKPEPTPTKPIRSNFPNNNTKPLILPRSNTYINLKNPNK